MYTYFLILIFFVLAPYLTKDKIKIRSNFIDPTAEKFTFYSSSQGSVKWGCDCV